MDEWPDTLKETDELEIQLALAELRVHLIKTVILCRRVKENLRVSGELVERFVDECVLSEGEVE